MVVSQILTMIYLLNMNNIWKLRTISCKWKFNVEERMLYYKNNEIVTNKGKLELVIFFVFYGKYDN